VAKFLIISPSHSEYNNIMAVVLVECKRWAFNIVKLIIISYRSEIGTGFAFMSEEEGKGRCKCAK
jgi:hypothetical protein